MAPELEDDYYFDELGRMVFTEAYHRRRGSCCKSGCRHCPYGFNPLESAEDPEKSPPDLDRSRSR